MTANAVQQSISKCEITKTSISVVFVIEHEHGRAKIKSENRAMARFFIGLGNLTNAEGGGIMAFEIKGRFMQDISKMSEKDLRIARFGRYILDVFGSSDEYDICLQFYLIDWCNCSCMDCYRRSSPLMSKTTPPAEDIEYLVNLFSALPNFGHQIGYSGGEPSAIPTDKLQRMIQAGLDSNSGVEFITNASFMRSPAKSAKIFQMLYDLKSTDGNFISQPKIEKIAESIKDWDKLKLKERSRILSKESSRGPSFNMTVSVDNVIHHPQSADNFSKLAKKITTDPILARKVGLSVATFDTCMDWFRDKIFKNPELNCSDIIEDGRGFDCKINGCRVNGLAGEFSSPDGAEAPETTGQIVQWGKANSRMVIYTWPNRTIGFQNELGNPTVQVPYVDDKGYKDLETLWGDMAVGLVKNYMEKVNAEYALRK